QQAGRLGDALLLRLKGAAVAERLPDICLHRGPVVLRTETAARSPQISNLLKYLPQDTVIGAQLFHGEGSQGTTDDSIEPRVVDSRSVAALRVVHRPLQHLHGEVGGLDHSGNYLRVFTGVGQIFLWPG